MSSIELSLICEFRPNKIFLSTLLFSCGVRIETLCTTHVRKNYYLTDSHTNYQFLEKVKIWGFGCYKHKHVSNLADDDFLVMSFWEDPIEHQRPWKSHISWNLNNFG